jgi:hypothetical protein
VDNRILLRYELPVTAEFLHVAHILHHRSQVAGLATTKILAIVAAAHMLEMPPRSEGQGMPGLRDSRDLLFFRGNLDRGKTSVHE